MKNYVTITASFFYFIVLRSRGLVEEYIYFDYDAVKNYMIAQEIATQDYSSLFHHGAPLMNLFHGFLFIVLNKNIVYIPIILSSIGTTILLQTIFITLNIKDLKTIITTILLTGSSFLLVNTGRYFSLEPYTLFFFSVWFYFYSLRAKHYTHLWILGLLIFINYKMAILIPYCIFNEYYLHKTPLKEYCKYIIPTWILPFSMILSILTNQSILTYTKTLFALFFLRRETTSFQSSTFSFSLDFYSKYIIYFEHPIIIAGLIYSIYSIALLLKSKKEVHSLISLPLFFFTFMIFLPSAPRAIMLVIPFLCINGIHSFQLLTSKLKLNNNITFTLLGISAIYSLYILQVNTYSKSTSGYSKIASYISTNNIYHLYSTSGIGIEPYLNTKQTKNTPLITAQEYKQIPKGSFVLVDSEALINGWKTLPKGECLISSTNKCKSQLMLGLENSEYSGLDLNEVIEANKKIVSLNNAQLCIIKKGD